MKKSILLALLLLLTFTSFAGGQQDKTDQSQIITLGAPRDLIPGEGDFYYATAMVKVWEPLIGVDDQWQPSPVLAESWESNKEATQWTFHLRQGVSFQDGTPFNADAVMANFDRYTKANPGKSKFYTFTINRFYPNYDHIEKIDDYQVRLFFTQSTPSLPYFMSSFGSPMFSPNCFDQEGNFTGTARGTGPFKIVERVPEQYTILERYDDYWGTPAKAEQIKIRVIPDGNSRYSALKTEEILGVLDLGSIQPNLAVQLLKDDRFADSVAKSSIIHYIAPNGTQFPFNDLRMRQAISLMVDRDLIAKNLYSGYVTPAFNIINYASPFYKDLKGEHNPTKAKELAREVLGDKQITADLLVPSPFTGKYPYKEQAEYIKSVLAPLGINLNIKMLEWGALREAQKTGNYGLAIQIQGLPSGEPYSILNSFMRSNQGQNKSYSLGYSNPKVDALLEKAADSTDMDTKASFYEQLQVISHDELPFIPLVNDSTLVVYNKRLKGYKAAIYGITIDTIEWADK